MNGYRYHFMLNTNKIWRSKNPDYTKEEAKKFNRICIGEFYMWASPDNIEKFEENLKKELEILCKNNPDEYNMHPYVEINGLYDGVRIRRITHLKNQSEFVKEADKIFIKFCEKINKK